MKRLLLVFISLSLLTLGFAQKGYKIEVKVKGAENGQIILGYHKAENLLPVDTAKADANGYAVFKGDKKLTKGLYLIFLPNRTYFDIIMGDDQNFYVQTDTSDLYGHLVVKGSKDNEIYLDYLNFMKKLATKATKIENELKNAETAKEKEKLRKQLANIEKERDNYIEQVVKKYPNLFVSKFLMATVDVKIPDSLNFKKCKTRADSQKVQLARYLWLKKHYFDNFDLSDISMLYTPLYGKKVDYYLDNVILQHPDSLNQAVDYLLAKTKNNKELYKWMLIHLFNKYARSHLMIAENVYVHLAEIYIRDATWSSPDFINRLKSRIARKKNCLVGETAPQMTLAVLPNDSAKIEQLRIPLEEMRQKGLELEKKYPKFDDRIAQLSDLLAQYMSNFKTYVNLDQIKAKYIVLWFMDPECSHCRAETPELYKYFVDDLQKKDVVVLDVYLERNTDDWNRFCRHIGKWFDFVEKHHFYAKGWINAWNPFDKHRFYYDINATPKVYLLDKDKKIIAKNIGPKQIKEIIDNMEAADKNKQSSN